jgi:uncharacterized protein YutE (UPF0331/DUF86 family)
VSPTKISRRIFLDRTAWVQRMVAQIRLLPLSDQHAFMADSRNVLAAESCLRRALEALFDTGRHVLARAFGTGTSEYKEIADALAAHGVLAPAQAGLLKLLAGYRNRLVHFYHEVAADELFEICSGQLQDILELVDALRRWVDAHPQLVDTSL